MNEAEEGTDVTVPVTLTEPKISTETLKNSLFKDVLGSGSTKCSSPAERWYNIDLAASRVNRHHPHARRGVLLQRPLRALHPVQRL